MEVVYQRCAGVDVHQRFLVVCLSSVEGGQRRPRGSPFPQRDSRSVGVTHMVSARKMQCRGDGKYERVLDAGLSAFGGLLRTCCG